MTREQAIEIVKTQYPHDHVMKTALGLLIPELRESEDEWIPKELIEYLKHKDDYRSCWIAWLEKQKGQNHDGKKWIYEDDYHKDMERCFNDGKDEVLENPEKYELQKEQKPAEWSKVDKEMLMRCIAAIPVQGDEIMPTSYLNKLRNWLEFLPERFNPPTKQEWSETDEKMLTGIIERGSVQVPPYTTALREEQIEWLMNRLKSLRPQPHWKPSEEQIEALKFAVKLYKDTHFENNHEKIVSLYEQLKKLM